MYHIRHFAHQTAAPVGPSSEAHAEIPRSTSLVLPGALAMELSQRRRRQRNSSSLFGPGHISQFLVEHGLLSCSRMALWSMETPPLRRVEIAGLGAKGIPGPADALRRNPTRCRWFLAVLDACDVPPVCACAGGSRGVAPDGRDGRHVAKLLRLAGAQSRHRRRNAHRPGRVRNAGRPLAGLAGRSRSPRWRLR